MSAVDELASLSVQSVTLPTFPGATAAEQLLNGRNAVVTILRKYVPDMQFDVASAQQTLDEIGAWEERNRDELKAAIGSQNVQAVPAQIALQLGSQKAQAFIIAIFTQAAAGLGPWTSGTVDQSVAEMRVVSGTPITATWSKVDADTRLQVFGSIVKMEQSGYLQTLFVPPAGTNGLGLPFVAGWVVVLAVTALIALVAILSYIYASKRLEANNKLMGDMCKEAQARGEQDVVKHCIDATRDLQLSDPLGLSEASKTFFRTLAYVGVGYIGLVYVLPAAFGSLRKRKK